jgi:hypothetical protein
METPIAALACDFAQCVRWERLISKHKVRAQGWGVLCRADMLSHLNVATRGVDGKALALSGDGREGLRTRVHRKQREPDDRGLHHGDCRAVGGYNRLCLERVGGVGERGK